MEPLTQSRALNPTADQSTRAEMGVRNYLIEGVSGAGKTSVAEALQRRGYHVIHGDRALAYVGDPETGEPLDGPPHEVLDNVTWGYEHWIWPVDKVRSLVADQRNAISFFCGGSRNFPRFIDLFDGVFVLDIDLDTLNRRLAGRPEDEFGGKPAEREFTARVLATKEGTPKIGVIIDATAPLERVVDEILSKCGEAGRTGFH
jgi:adenylate kinase family enzyme